MALSDKYDGGDSSSGDEVTPEQAEILELLEENSQALKAQDIMLEKAAKKLRKLKAKLVAALEEIERLRSVRPEPVELECPTCQDLMGDLCELKSKYAGQVEELDGLKAKCG